MFKVSNRNTRKRCILISKITLKHHNNVTWLLAICRRYCVKLALYTVQGMENHTLDSVQCQFAIKSLSSVLRSSSTACNFNKSRPIYVILWEIRNNSWTIWFMKNSKYQHFLFLKKQPQKWTNFVPSKDRYFSIIKLDILIFCNILHLEMGFWNLSWKRIVSS